MKHNIFLTLGITLLFIFACRNLPSSVIPVDDKETEGYTISTTGCKSNIAKTLDNSYANTEDVIKYTYRDNGLDIEHINAGFNCCPDTAGGHVFVQGDSLIILEFEEFGETGGCRCLCLFDVTYRIVPLNKGMIHLKIEQLCISEDDALHEYTINLNESPEGEFIINRDNYPWY